MSTAPEAPPYTPSAHLLMEVADMWLYHHDYTAGLVSASAEFPEAVPPQLLRMAQLAAVNGLAFLYVLQLLRREAPDVADRAAPLLSQDVEAWPKSWQEDMRAVVVSWVDDALVHRPTYLPTSS